MRRDVDIPGGGEERTAPIWVLLTLVGSTATIVCVSVGVILRLGFGIAVDWYATIIALVAFLVGAYVAWRQDGLLGQLRRNINKLEHVQDALNDLVRNAANLELQEKTVCLDAWSAGLGDRWDARILRLLGDGRAGMHLLGSAEGPQEREYMSRLCAALSTLATALEVHRDDLAQLPRRDWQRISDLVEDLPISEKRDRARSVLNEINLHTSFEETRERIRTLLRAT
jgi:hypothetical protein